MNKYPFIKEIGDLSAKPYEYTLKNSVALGGTDAEFTTDSGLDYIINFWVKDRAGYSVVKCSFYLPQLGGPPNDGAITNKGEMFRILATFAKVFKEVEPKYEKHAEEAVTRLVFNISGIKKGSERSSELTARTRIYLAYVNSNSYIKSKYKIDVVKADNSIFLTKKEGLTEMYKPMPNTPKNIAKAAIRDIFIQMPTRTVHEMNWKGLLGQVIGIVGEEITNEAVEDLKSEGWLSFSEELWRWRKMFGPVNPINTQPYFPPTLLEHINYIDRVVNEATNNILEVRPLKTPEEMDLYKQFIMQHYLAVDPSGVTDRLGIFRAVDGAMIGLVSYGIPVDTAIRRELSDFELKPLFGQGEIIELKRLWALDDDKVHNAESQAISLGNTEIASIHTNVKVIVTYADSKHHTGVVYKASNAIEITSPGSSKMRFFYPVGNPTTRKIVRKKLEWYKANLESLRAAKKAARAKIKEDIEVKVNDYGCLMAIFNRLLNWKKVLGIIKPEDVYNDETGQLGYEKEPHATILYGFAGEITHEDIKELAKKIKGPIAVKVSGISHFDNELYDVVKLDVNSEQIQELHKMFATLDHIDTYPEYLPHMTIAYVKKGMGKKYDRTIEKRVFLKTDILKYGYADGRYAFLKVKSSEKSQL